MTPERRAVWTALGLAAGLVALTGWSLRYFARYQPFADLIQTSQRSPLGEIGLEIQGATLSGRTAGRLRWRVHAASVTLSRDGRTAQADRLQDGLVWDDAGRPVLSLWGGDAQFHSFTPLLQQETAGHLEVDGAIRARVLRPGGPTLAADGLRWDGLSHTAQAVGPATAVFPARPGPLGGLRVAADGLTWDGRSALLTAPAASLRWPGGAWARGANVTADLNRQRLSLVNLRGGFPTGGLPAPFHPPSLESPE